MPHKDPDARKRYRVANRERDTARHREWIAANQDRWRAYLEANKEHFREQNTKRKRKHRTVSRAEYNAYMRAYNASNREEIRSKQPGYDQRKRERHGPRINAETAYRKLLRNEAALGRKRPATCDECGREGKIVFDHCHAKGHPRGWLCQQCNSALGMVNDSRIILRKLIAYLDRTQESTAPQLVLVGI